MSTVPSNSDKRVVNNTLRHNYRVLTDKEKELMNQIKDKGLEFLELVGTMDHTRETALAKTKIEESVMWAVKEITK